MDFKKKAFDIARNVRFNPKEDVHIFSGEIEQALKEAWNEAIEASASTALNSGDENAAYYETRGLVIRKIRELKVGKE